MHSSGPTYPAVHDGDDAVPFLVEDGECLIELCDLFLDQLAGHGTVEQARICNYYIIKVWIKADKTHLFHYSLSRQKTREPPVPWLPPP